MIRVLLPVTITLMAIFPVSAHAYLDPGSGSMIIQSLIATALIVGTAIGAAWQQIKDFFRRIFFPEFKY